MAFVCKTPDQTSRFSLCGRHFTAYVRGLLDEIVYFPFARYIDEAAHKDFVNGQFGRAWEYPPADLLEEILVN